MKVYVVQENIKFDYSGAEEFGELVFLTKNEFRPHNNSRVNDGIIEEILTGLVPFNESDYLLLTGNPITMAYAFHAVVTCLKRRGVPFINLLRWDNLQHRYISIKFNI